MAAVFEMPIPSETLDSEEVEKITGCHRKGDQIQWLTVNGWLFHTTKGGEPVIGRMYARLKMAGINPSSLATTGGWVPDFSKVS